MDAWVDRLKSRAFQKERNHSSLETALHEACYSGCCLEAMKGIVALHPEAIAMKDRNGLTPLHWALASKTQHSKARELLDYFNTINGTRSASGSSRNSRGIRYDESHDTDNTINNTIDTTDNDNDSHGSGSVLLMEEALLCTTDLGYTALHHACLSDASSDLIHDLVSCCTKSASTQRHGKTPLHMLIEYVNSKHTTMNTASIQTLINTYPQATRVTDNQGCTPLHYACYTHTNTDAFHLLLQHSFDALAITNTMGQTPLHCAASHNAPLSVIHALVQTYPMALTVRDVDGNSPLHLACREKTSALLKARLLIGAGETSLVGENGRGQTPLQLCRDVGEVYALLRLVPHYMRHCQ